jgi:hypothetical protein
MPALKWAVTAAASNFFEICLHSSDSPRSRDLIIPRPLTKRPLASKYEIWALNLRPLSSRKTNLVASPVPSAGKCVWATMLRARLRPYSLSLDIPGRVVARRGVGRRFRPQPMFVLVAPAVMSISGVLFLGRERLGASLRARDRRLKRL